MGTMITFPEERRYARPDNFYDVPATVIILPVIRIERREAPSDREPQILRGKRHPRTKREPK